MKKNLIYQALIVLFLTVVYTVLISYLKQNAFVENPRLIKIMNGTPADGSLTLDPQNPVTIGRGKKIKWKISAHSNVDSFSIVQKPGSTDIFAPGEKPPRRKVKEGEAKVDSNAPMGADYVYSIVWYENTHPGLPHTFDPKISVNPRFIDNSLFIFIAGGFILALLSLFGINALSHRRRN